MCAMLLIAVLSHSIARILMAVSVVSKVLHSWS